MPRRDPRTTSDRALALYEFIIAFKRTHDGNTPSYAEMCEATGITSTGAIKGLIFILEAQGFLQSIDGRTRSMRVTGGQWSMGSDSKQMPNADFFPPAWQSDEMGALHVLVLLRQGALADLPLQVDFHSSFDGREAFGGMALTSLDPDDPVSFRWVYVPATGMYTIWETRKQDGRLNVWRITLPTAEATAQFITGGFLPTEDATEDVGAGELVL